MKRRFLNMSKLQVFFAALIIGIISGNLLTSLSYKAEKKLWENAGGEMSELLYQTKLKSNRDSIWYNEEIEKLSTLLYDKETNNPQVTKNQVKKSSAE